ncbi:acetyltransferase, GNAT family [Aspergillus avenaceus]|uniref:Acetyltransferase, GNAT family n=1 Tax=Aspergillus avenaceus TaxID=36643 RepID=A0A5N6TLK0_ASPAV|nr:acetyltransferase, GNAT family [Aspergillus avenaceus]
MSLGKPVALPPARSPTGTTLEGRTVKLEHLSPAHAEDLFAAVCNKDHIWTYFPDGPFHENDRDAFQSSIVAKSNSTDPLFYAVIDRQQNRPVGYSSYLRIVPEHMSIEIGWVLFSPTLQRTTAATEVIYLLIKHAFEDLGYRRVEWKCDSLNGPSNRAAARFGFTFEGIFRQHMVAKGRNRDTAWYSMLKDEWDGKGLKRAFETWLGEENFDEGKQKESLETTRNRIQGK